MNKNTVEQLEDFLDELFAPILNDFYKQGHGPMYPAKTSKVYSNLTARKSRVLGVNTVVVAGIQPFIKKYLLGIWNFTFFNRDFADIKGKFLYLINNTLGPDAVDIESLEKLHKLGYLPISIKALPEGVSVDIRVPFFTITNTVDHAYWLVNFLETLISAQTWQIITSATIAREFRKLLNKFSLETVGNTDFVQWQGHDFSYRGMGSTETAILSGMGHLFSFTGTDTIPAIPAAARYYNTRLDKELIGASVPATEHAVAGFNINAIHGDKELMTKLTKEFIDRTPDNLEKQKKYPSLLIAEYGFLKWLITEKYPKGIISYVADTYNIFDVVAEILPRLKPEIMARKGGFPVDKLVIRPDSFWTDPIDCLCGFGGYHPQMDKLTKGGLEVVRKGLIESLWDIFGGTETAKGYRLLDSHIGAIYGDSITIERARGISERLKAKGFASINSVYGIGSYTYQYVTRDTFGLAIKATYGIVDEKPIEVFKEPVSDDGMKKSAKGLIRVDGTNGKYTYKDCCTPEEEAGGELKEIFRDGKLLIEYTLAEVRARVMAGI